MRNLGRLSLTVALAATAGVGFAMWAGGAGGPTSEGRGRKSEVGGQKAEVTGQRAEDGRDVLAPDPRLTPDEVVAYQVRVLGQSGRGEAGIRHCYRFASPLNRAATGPIGRFVGMVRSPTYEVMLRAVDTLVGEAVVREDRATVLVTLLDSGRQIRVFRFFLSKQRESPYEGCWMTDAVREVISPGPPARGPDAATPGPAVGV